MIDLHASRELRQRSVQMADRKNMVSSIGYKRGTIFFHYFLVLYFISSAALNAVTPNTSIYLLSIYVAVLGVMYVISLGEPLGVLAILLSAAMPYLFFDPSNRFIDGMYYEAQLNHSYWEFLRIVFDSIYNRIYNSENQTRGSFLLLIYPLLKPDAEFSDYKFVAFNYTIIFSCAMLVRELASDFCRRNGFSESRLFISRFSFYLFLLSPSSLFFSGDILKDQTSMMLVLLSTLMFVRRHLFLFGFALIAATSVRSYNPLIIACFICAVDWPSKRDLFVIIAVAAAMFVVVRGSPAAIVNMIAASVYVYVNPLPIRLENWLYPTGLLTAQGLLFFVAWVGSLQVLTEKRLRVIGAWRLPVAIALFGCILIAVGYNNTVNLTGNDYTIGKGGDNMTRKSFPILPLICIQLAVSMILIKGWITSGGNRIGGNHKNRKSLQSIVH